MHIIGYVLYIGIGFVQFIAIMHGLDHLFGIPILSLVLALLLTLIPLVGAATGVYGAIVAWGWEWYWAASLFFGIFGIAVLLAGGIGIWHRVTGRTALEQ